MLQTSSGGFFRGFAVCCALCFRVVVGVACASHEGGGGGADNVHLCRVHRAGSMKWLTLLLYVVLVLRLSNVADLRLLPLTPLLRFRLVEVKGTWRHCCGGQSPGPPRPWCSMPS